MALIKQQEEILEKIYSIRVHNPLNDKLHLAFDEKRIQKREAGYNSGIKHMFVFGVSGVGKSFCCQEYLSQNPSQEISDGRRINKISPVVYCEVPHPFDLTTFYVDLLSSLGIRRIGKDKDLKEQVITNLKNQKCQILFLDEFQHVLSFNPQKQIKLMDTIKHFANRAGVVLVCIGKPEISTLRDENTQLFRRFDAYPVDRLANDETFLYIINQFEKALELKFATDQPKEKIASVIHKTTMGIFHYMKELLLEAGKIAKLEGNGSGEQKGITLRIIEEASKRKLTEFNKKMREKVETDEIAVKEFLELFSSRRR